MDDWSGRFNYWEEYSNGNINKKRSLLEPVARKIMKDMVVPAKSYSIWEQKLNILIDHLIKGYDIQLEYMRREIKKIKDEYETDTSRP